jgi:hypothetical protein
MYSCGTTMMVGKRERLEFTITNNRMPSKSYLQREEQIAGAGGTKQIGCRQVVAVPFPQKNRINKKSQDAAGMSPTQAQQGFPVLYNTYLENSTSVSVSFARPSPTRNKPLRSRAKYQRVTSLRPQSCATRVCRSRNVLGKIEHELVGGALVAHDLASRFLADAARKPLPVVPARAVLAVI